MCKVTTLIRNLCSQLRIFFIHLTNSLVYFILDGRWFKDNKLLSIGRQFADKFIIGNTIQGEEYSSLQLMIIITQLKFGITFQNCVAAMDRLSLNIALRCIAYPAEDVFYGSVFVESYAYDVFEAFCQVLGTLCIFLFGERLNLIYSIEGKGKYLLVAVGSTQRKSDMTDG